MADLKLVGAVAIKVRPDSTDFKRELQRQLAGKKGDARVSVPVDADTSALPAQVDEAAQKVSKKRLTLKVGLDRESVLAAQKQLDKVLRDRERTNLKVKLDNPASIAAARAELERRLAEAPIELKVNYDDKDSLKAARSRLQAILNDVVGTDIKIEFNEAALREEINKLNNLIQDEVDDKIKVDVPVHASRLEIVARQLQFASRARRVPFYVVVDAKSVAVAEGILRSLAGVNTLQSAGRGLETLITKFDTISIKSGAWGAAIGGLVDTLLFMTSSLFTVGDGMLEVVGLAALAPAAFAALASTMFIGVSVFRDFGDAVSGIEQAMKRLPPSGQKAARLIKQVFADLRESISEKFWSTASDAMLRFAETALPAFTRGFVKTSEKLGVVFGGILDSFTNIAAAGQLDTMFDNLALMFENGATGATALWDALNILGLRGSEFLPRFGQWLADISHEFLNWITINDANGNINAWIEDGITSLKDMFFASGAIIDQFKAIARAAGLIGPNGLDDFRRNMEHIARVMLAEPWQSDMASIFSGARQGAHELADGFRDFFGAMKDSAFWTGQLLTLLGQLGGDALSGFGTTISNFTFQQGVLDGLRGMSAMVRDMEPAFDKLGGVIGRLGTIAGSTFRGLAPVFNTLLGILDDITSRVSDNLTKIAPELLDLTNSLLSFVRGPIVFLAEVLNNFLTVINNLPGPLRDAALAFGTFLLLRNQFGAFARALDTTWSKMTSQVVKSTDAIVSTTTGNFVRMADGSLRQVQRMADGTDRAFTRFGSAVNRGVSVANAAVLRFNGQHIPNQLNAVAGTVPGIVSRINGALSLIGGIPGLAIGAIGIAMATIGGNAAKSAADVDRLRGSLDKLTGASTPETLAIIAESISQIGEAGDSWANFWRGVVRGAEAGNETLDKLGINVGDAAKAISGSQKDFDAFVGTFEDIRKAQNIRGFEDFFKTGQIPGALKIQDFQNGGKGTRELTLTEEDVEILRDGRDAFDKLGISIENLPSGASLDVLMEKMKEQRFHIEIAQKKQQIYADTLGVTSRRAAEVAAITQTLGDKSLDASGKIDAIRRSLEILNGRDNAQAAEILKMDQLEAGLENAKAIAESVKAAGDGLLGSNGLLNSQSKAARDLFKILQEQADNVLVQGQKAYDAAVQNGDTTKVAVEKAMAAVRTGRGDLQKFAEAVGVDVSVIKAQFDSFFGEDWTLEATFIGRPDLFLAAAQQAKEAGVEFDKSEFTAWLLAEGDPALVTVDEVREYINKFANEEYKAKLLADKQPAIDEIALALGMLEEYKNGNYQAIVRAHNDAAPGVREAITEIERLTKPGDPWRAILFTAMDGGSLSYVQGVLQTLARPILVQMQVRVSDLQQDAAAAARGAAAAAQRAADAQLASSVPTGFRAWPSFANGGIVRPKYFADGGIERHVAQIARPGIVPRVWAEKETHGEAYIPYAQSKRPRSVSILGQVARDFGYQLTKAQEFVNGGTTVQPSGATNTASVHIGQLIAADTDEAVRKIRTSQQDALAVAGMILNGA